MTLLPVADGARLLGIHPKTLHHWLKEANMLLVTHPTDARIKCVTEEHAAPGSQLAWPSTPGISAIGCNLSFSRSVSGERSPCA